MKRGVFGIIPQCLAELMNRVGQGLVGDEVTLPNGFDELYVAIALSETPSSVW